ncbi:hypothetical protein T439DRAFT_359383 [Meredithblackwellia eburnea MCA 4105]
MAQQPPKLTYNNKTYLTLSTHTPSSVLLSSSNTDDSDPDSPVSGHSQSQSSTTSTSSSTGSSLLSSLSYVGPVGQLPNDHIYSIDVPTTNPPTEEVKSVKKWLERNVDGVSNVELMMPRKRAKGNFEC